MVEGNSDTIRDKMARRDREITRGEVKCTKSLSANIG